MRSFGAAVAFCGVFCMPLAAGVGQAEAGPKSGALVVSIVPESQAVQLGIQPGEVITAVAGQPVTGMQKLGALSREMEKESREVTLWSDEGTRRVQAGPGKLGVYLADYENSFGQPLREAVTAFHQKPKQAVAPFQLAIKAGLRFNDESVLQVLYALALYYSGNLAGAKAQLDDLGARLPETGWLSTVRFLSDTAPSGDHLLLYAAARGGNTPGISLALARRHAFDLNRYPEAIVAAERAIQSAAASNDYGNALNCQRWAFAHMNMKPEALHVVRQMMKDSDTTWYWGAVALTAEQFGAIDLAADLAGSMFDLYRRGQNAPLWAAEHVRLNLAAGRVDAAESFVRNIMTDRERVAVGGWHVPKGYCWERGRGVWSVLARSVAEGHGRRGDAIDTAFRILAMEEQPDLAELERLLRLREQFPGSSRTGDLAPTPLARLKAELALARGQSDDAEKLLQSMGSEAPAALVEAARFLQRFGNSLVGERAMWLRTNGAFRIAGSGWFLLTRDQQLGRCSEDGSAIRRIPSPSPSWWIPDADQALLVSPTGRTVLATSQRSIYRYDETSSHWRVFATKPWSRGEEWDLAALQPVLDEVAAAIEAGGESRNFAWPDVFTPGKARLASLMLSDGTWLTIDQLESKLLLPRKVAAELLGDEVEVYHVLPAAPDCLNVYLLTSRGLLRWRPFDDQTSVIELPGADQAPVMRDPNQAGVQEGHTRIAVLPMAGGGTFLLENKTGVVTADVIINEAYPDTYWPQRPPTLGRRAVAEGGRKAGLPLEYLAPESIGLMHHTAEARAASHPAPGASTSRPAAQRWALIASPEITRWGLADLLQNALAALPGVQFVERERIDAVLGELSLSQLAGAEGVASRVQLGKLLGADVLVFLRDRRLARQNETSIELAVARTDLGVRFLMDQVMWDSSRAEAITSGLVETIARGRSLSDRADLRLFAIPPFENLDVGREHEEQRRGFARLMEQFLVRRGGIAVVEFEEARAIGRELAISGTGLRRELPFYLMGSYTITGMWDERSVGFNLELRQGEGVVATLSREKMPIAELSASLEAGLEELLRGGNGDPAKADMDLEARLLTERGRTFRRIGDLDQAMPLWESALLCRPDYRDAHLELYRGYVELMTLGGYKQLWVRALPYSPRGRMEAAEKALDHLRAALVRDPVGISLAVELPPFYDSFNLFRYDTEEDWDRAVPVRERVWTMQQELLARGIKDDRLPGDDKVCLLRFASHGVRQRFQSRYRADPQGVIQEAVRWIQALDEFKITRSALLVQAETLEEVLRLCAGNADACDRFVAALLASRSEQARFIGELGQCLCAIHDAQTLGPALSRIEDLLGTNRARGTLRTTILEYARSRAGQKQASATGPAEGALQADAAQKLKPVMIPELTCLSALATFHGRRGTSQTQLRRISDWVVCGPDLEILETVDWACRLVGPVDIARFDEKSAERGSWLQMDWDGRYIWALRDRAISVFDTEAREVARFEASELKSMAEAYQFRCVPISPGRLCVVGVVPVQPVGVRTWAAILSCDQKPGGHAKRIEPFFEARVQASGKGDAEDLDRAFSPTWAAAVPRPGGGEALVMVNRHTERPLILDPVEKTARVSPHALPKASCVSQEADGLYMAGGVDPPALYRVASADEPPALITRFRGIKGAARNPLPTWIYSFRRKNGIFHLYGGTPGRKEASWIAFDPQTAQIYVLGDPMPDGHNAYCRIVDSRQYDLGFTSGGRAFGVKLPDVSKWPTLEERSRYPMETTTEAAQAAETAAATAGDEVRLLKGHTHAVRGIAFLPDGRHAISAGRDKTVVLWDVESGKSVNVLQGHEDFINTLALSPDGRIAVTGGSGGSLHVWDIGAGEHLRTFGAEYGKALYGLAFSPQGRKVVSGGSDGVLRMWDVDEARQVWSVQAHPATIWAVAFSHDGRFVLSGAMGSDNWKIRLTDAVTGREVRAFWGQTFVTGAVAFSPDDKTALSADTYGRILAWDVATGRLLKRMQSNPDGVFGIAFLPDGKHFLTAGGNVGKPYWLKWDGTHVSEEERTNPGGDDTVKMFNLETGEEVGYFEGHTRCVHRVAVSPDGRFALTGGDDATLRLWSLTSPPPRKAKPPPAGTNDPSAMGPDEREARGLAASEPTTPLAFLAGDKRVQLAGAVLGGGLVLLASMRILRALTMRRHRRKV